MAFWKKIDESEKGNKPCKVRVDIRSFKALPRIEK